MNYSEYLEFAKGLAKQAGARMRADLCFGMEHELKSDESRVTESDVAINTLVLNAVAATYPDHNVRAEEGSHIDGDRTYVWVCDPIDGTRPFSHGIPVSTFSLALTENGHSVVGVVYDPFMDRMFTAVKGGGAFLNGERISVSDEPLKGSFSATIWPSENPYVPMEFFRHLATQERVKYMALASIVYSAMLVAVGESAFTAFHLDTAHDAAAVKIIVEEAGGKVTDVYGEQQRYDTSIRGFIASNGVVHDNLLTILRTYQS